MKTNHNKLNDASFNIHSDLIEACKRNDQQAQFRIYKLYYRSMYNVSLRIVNDSMEAEDIMQESFLAAFEQIRSYTGSASFGAWLKKIVQNRSIDALRKKGKIVFEEVDESKDIADYSSVGAVSDDEPDQRMNRVMESIKNLSSCFRTIFSLYFLEGYDYEEISKILSISESTSRSQLSRARRRVIEDLNCRK
jgi:RNA polymerase sigma factor (sigma-70 family)